MGRKCLWCDKWRPPLPALSQFRLLGWLGPSGHARPYIRWGSPLAGLCPPGQTFLILLGNSHFLYLCPSAGPPALTIRSPSTLLFAVVFSLKLWVLSWCLCVSGGACA